MFDSLILRGKKIAPAVFCAPMAGITHCAFRRLVSDFGGYGALFTEMLSAGSIPRETFENSPYVRKRPCEGNVFYQLLLTGDENIGVVIEKIRSFEPAGLDINLSCNAWNVRKMGGGSSLLKDKNLLKVTMSKIRGMFDGPLTAKLRLGEEKGGWQDKLVDTISVLKACGVDAVILHPRFNEEKFRKRARHEIFNWACRTFGMPVIANGDIADIFVLKKEYFSAVAGVMIGRMAAVKPWIFAEWNGKRIDIDYAEVWMRFFNYVKEDFHPQKQLSRIKIFTEYFSRNFVFGHHLFTQVQSSRTLGEAKERAEKFFAGNPEINYSPHVMGIS